MIATERMFCVKGRIVDAEGRPIAGISVKAYGKRGGFLAGARTNKDGRVEFESGARPEIVKLISKGTTVGEMDFPYADGSLDFGEYELSIEAPAEWHIKGRVKDAMSGDPLQSLTVEVWDRDPHAPDDPLGEDLTDAAGEFNVWFNSSAIEAEPGPNPDVYIQVKNSQNVVIHETAVDWNIPGTPHDCSPYTAHQGKEYDIEVDYVTVLLNKVGPVATADIESSGRAPYDGISERPFGGTTSIEGRIWGAKVDQWGLYVAEGFVDSNAPCFTDLEPLDEPAGLDLIANGTDQVWDGLIHTWDTGDLEAAHTLILVVWDEDGNEYHDTQIVFLHNTAITPPAEISAPAAGSTLSKGAGTTVEVEGTASDDYFLKYHLYWAGGPTQTELTTAGIAYPLAGNETEVLGDKLGEWDVSSLAEGPYFVRLTVVDRTIYNDGAYNRKDWTWNTVLLTA